jgi:hypothetical protein
LDILEDVIAIELQDDSEFTLSVSIPGAQGPVGSQILSGDGSPPAESGNDGDYWFDSTNKILYGPKDEVWPGSGVEIGTVTARHVHVQSISSATWTISHGLFGRPFVLVFDSDDELIYTDVEWPSDDQVIISSPTPFTGSAYLT